MYNPRMKKAESRGVGRLMDKVLRLFKANADARASPTYGESTEYESAFVGAHVDDTREAVHAMMYADGKRAMALAEWQRHNRPC